MWGAPGNGPRSTGPEGRRDVFASSGPKAMFSIAWCHVVQHVTEIPTSLGITSFINLK